MIRLSASKKLALEALGLCAIPVTVFILFALMMWVLNVYFGWTWEPQS